MRAAAGEGTIPKRIVWHLRFVLIGAVAICIVAAIQHAFVLKVPLSIHKFLIPSLVGGAGGLLVGLWLERLQTKNLALRESEERFRIIFQNAGAGMGMIDPEGIYLEVNPVLCQYLGYSSSELVGRSVFSVTHPEDLEKSRDWQRHVVQATKCSSLVEKRYLRKDGETVWGHVSLAPFYDETGKLLYVVSIVQDITEQMRSKDEIRQLAFYDTLSGLPNRTLFFDRLEQTMARAARDGDMVALLFLDLDQFKRINDTLGHATGDRLLVDVARRLQKCVRGSDTVARLGGDEFVIILSALRHQQDVAGAARHLLEVLADPYEFEGREVFCTASIGIALFPTDGTTTELLIKNADMAMYQAKDRGRNIYQFFSEQMNRQALERLEMETALRRALQRNELFLVYQPQLDLQSGRTTGVEALLRWRHPKDGLISPSRFIPLAEETGLIFAIGEWVLRTACAQAKAWQTAGFAPLTMAVNLSGHQLKQPNLIDMIESVLSSTGLDPQWLELELTESSIMVNAVSTIETLTDIKVRGIRLAVDDFGTGYSSLNYLKNFPIDRIKIAQDFVRDIPGDVDDCAIVKAVIALAETLNLRLIAEGVETREQVDFLFDHRCREMQGFYFARPLPADEFLAYLNAGLAAGAACPFRVE